MLLTSMFIQLVSISILDFAHMSSLEDRRLCTHMHAYTRVHAHAHDYPVENTGIIYIPSEKIPILEFFTVQQRLRVHNILVFLPSRCNIIMLEIGWFFKI